ncbi:hypothetical protein A6A06_21890 [Streptomyces sp. CB02923]|uniref:hypothetical protein n=1 Tax=Streptomyces sp. CB02923 TaxID=1718985 RepID=UPI00093CD6C7|nr:hypothetical protein [Streptomyces sp. CB02923]OKH99735.1 hypothetical protein A6A06_21890 [Streptomyces sp. CB02923]
MRRATSLAPPGPPQPSPRRYNAVLRLYDAPLHRDWAFWLTVGLAALTAAAIGTSTEQASGLPRWLDTLLAVLTFTLLFGVTPAWARLRIRRWRWRKQQLRPPPPVSTPRETAPPHAPTPSPESAPPREPARRESARRESAYPPSPDPLATARRALPHPVARTVHEMQRAHTPKERHEALLEAAETLAVTTAGLLQAHGIGERNLAELRAALTGAGTTFGTWTVWLHHVCRVVRQRPDVVPGLAEALRDGSGPAAGPDDPGLVQFLDRLKGERNRTSHGDKPRTQEEASLRLAEHQLLLERALICAQFLHGLPWLLTVSCAYQRRTGTFEVVADHLMGDHPDFDRLTFPCPAPVADDTVYVLSPAGPVALSPFVASLYCAQCGRREICHAHRTGRRNRPAAYKSFGRGHVIPCPGLDDEIAALPGPPPSRP